MVVFHENLLFGYRFKNNLTDYFLQYMREFIGDFENRFFFIIDLKQFLNAKKR